MKEKHAGAWSSTYPLDPDGCRIYFVNSEYEYVTCAA